MLAGLLIVDGGGGRRAAAHGEAKGNGNQGLAVIEKQKAELGAYQRATHGPKNLHELDSPRESLLLCAARKLSQFSAERPRRATKRRQTCRAPYQFKVTDSLILPSVSIMATGLQTALLLDANKRTIRHLRDSHCTVRLKPLNSGFTKHFLLVNSSAETFELLQVAKHGIPSPLSPFQTSSHRKPGLPSVATVEQSPAFSNLGSLTVTSSPDAHAPSVIWRTVPNCYLLSWLYLSVSVSVSSPA